MEIPRNCWECQHKENCHAAHYGGSLCKYEKAITEATLEKMKG